MERGDGGDGGGVGNDNKIVTCMDINNKTQYVISMNISSNDPIRYGCLSSYHKHWASNKKDPDDAFTELYRLIRCDWNLRLVVTSKCFVGNTISDVMRQSAELFQQPNTEYLNDVLGRMISLDNSTETFSYRDTQTTICAKKQKVMYHVFSFTKTSFVSTLLEWMLGNLEKYTCRFWVIELGDPEYTIDWENIKPGTYEVIRPFSEN